MIRSAHTMGTRKRTSKAEPKRTEDGRLLKDDQIRIRVSAEHKAILSKAAEQAGLGVSSWLLSVGLRAAREMEEK